MGDKVPSWFDFEEIKKKGIEKVAKEKGIKPTTVRRAVNKAGYAMEDLEGKSGVKAKKATKKKAKEEPEKKLKKEPKKKPKKEPEKKAPSKEEKKPAKSKKEEPVKSVSVSITIDNISRDDFYGSKDDFEERLGRSATNAEFLRSLVAVYQVAAQE